MDPTTMRVLLVDDRTDLAAAVRCVLEGRSDLLLELIDDAVVAVDVARSLKPDVILQGWNLPGSSGRDLVEAYRRTAGLSDIPIITLAAGMPSAERSDPFALGAVDLLVDPPQEVELLARIRLQVERRRGSAERRPRVSRRPKPSGGDRTSTQHGDGRGNGGDVRHHPSGRGRLRDSG